MSIKRLGILTSGGDAPGMNAAIRAVVRTAIHHDIQCLGILRGYNGLINSDLKELKQTSVNGLTSKGGTILYKAHAMLEQLTLDKGTARMKAQLSVKYADLVYNGQWFTPLREALDAFVNKTQENVTGTVRLKLYKGNIIGAGMESPYSLYDEELASFGESDYNQADSAGFINLFGLPIKVEAVRKMKTAK